MFLQVFHDEGLGGRSATAPTDATPQQQQQQQQQQEEDADQPEPEVGAASAPANRDTGADDVGEYRPGAAEPEGGQKQKSAPQPNPYNALGDALAFWRRELKLIERAHDDAQPLGENSPNPEPIADDGSAPISAVEIARGDEAADAQVGTICAPAICRLCISDYLHSHDSGVPSVSQMLADATEEQFDQAEKPPKSAEDETAEAPPADAMPDEAEADPPASSANNAEEVPEPSRRDGPVRHPSRGALEPAATDDDDDDAVAAKEEANVGEGDARREKSDAGAELGEVNPELITDAPMDEAEEEGDETTLEAMQVCVVLWLRSRRAVASL